MASSSQSDMDVETSGPHSHSRKRYRLGSPDVQAACNLVALLTAGSDGPSPADVDAGPGETTDHGAGAAHNRPRQPRTMSTEMEHTQHQFAAWLHPHAAVHVAAPAATERRRVKARCARRSLVHVFNAQWGHEEKMHAAQARPAAAPLQLDVRMYGEDGALVPLVAQRRCTLMDLLWHHGRGLSEDLARSVARDVAASLVRLHADGFVHGRVGPASIAAGAESQASSFRLQLEGVEPLPVGPGGLTAAMDLARLFDAQQLRAPCQAQLQRAGLSPELHAAAAGPGRLALGRSADIWALGITLLALLLGPHPFRCRPPARSSCCSCSPRRAADAAGLLSPPAAPRHHVQLDSPHLVAGTIAAARAALADSGRARLPQRPWACSHAAPSGSGLLEKAAHRRATRHGCGSQQPWVLSYLAECASSSAAQAACRPSDRHGRPPHDDSAFRVSRSRHPNWKSVDEMQLELSSTLQQLLRCLPHAQPRAQQCSAPAAPPGGEQPQPLLADLLLRLLAVDPAQRPSAQQVLSHPWLAPHRSL